MKEREKGYHKMDKYELISMCIKQKSEIERLRWDLDVANKNKLYAEGRCMMGKTTKDDIIACVYDCEDCYKRREGT